MEYFKLSVDMDRENDIICHVGAGMRISLNTFVIGRPYAGEDEQICFTYPEEEGSQATDYLANDKGWFIVSEKLKHMMDAMNTEIQYLPIKITEERKKRNWRGTILQISSEWWMHCA